MTVTVCLWFAAIEIRAFSASNGEVPCVQIQPIFTCVKHLATIRVLLCKGPSSNAMFVSIPLRVDWSDPGIVQWLHTFVNVLIHSEVPQVFQFLFTSLAHFVLRQFFAGDVINAQDVLIFFSDLCQCRAFLTIASCEAFDDSLAQFSSS